MTIAKISEASGLTENEIKTIIENFKENFQKNINVETITDAVIQLMKIVEKLKKLSGQQKKSLVTEILIHIVEETNIGELDTILDHILINLIPILIDRFVSVQNGKIVFKKKSLFPCIKF